MSTAIAILPTANEWVMLKEMSHILKSSGMLPAGISSPAAALAIMMKGRELGMAPMYAFAHINLIKGKATQSAESMLAMILEDFPQTIINYVQYDKEGCIIEVTRPGWPMNRFSWTMEDAKAARLTTNENWMKYSRAMLRSRCVSEMARAIFPDSLKGASYTPEELGGDDPTLEPNDGEEVNVTPTETPKLPPEPPKYIFDRNVTAWLDLLTKHLTQKGIPPEEMAWYAEQLHGQQFSQTVINNLIEHRPFIADMQAKIDAGPQPEVLFADKA